MENLKTHFTDEEIAAEIRRMKAERSREYAKKHPEKRREYQRRWWEKQAAASLAAREQEYQHVDD